MASGFGPKAPGSITETANRVNAVYLLVKSVISKVPWLVDISLPWVLSLEKNSFPFRDISKLWKWSMDGAEM